jgi:hypothetical protein
MDIIEKNSNNESKTDNSIEYEINHDDTQESRREKYKIKLLEYIEIIDRYKDYNVIDVIFGRVKYNVFKLKENNYIIIYFPDEEEGSCNNDYYISGNEIIIEYLRKQDVNNKELSYNFWKQKKDLSNGIVCKDIIDPYSKRIQIKF